MTHRFLTALLAASLLAATSACEAAEIPARDPDVVWLKSLERLRGEVASLNTQTLGWKNSGISESLPLPLASVLRVNLGRRPFGGTNLANPCIVRLVNQDELAGGLVMADANGLQLATWYAGTLTIPRWGIASLQPIATNPKAVYQGPNSIEEWTLGQAVVPGVESNAWSYVDGALAARASGSVARDVKLPPQVSVEMDLSWTGYLGISIALFADSLQPMQLDAKDTGPDFGGFYSVQIMANAANIMLVRKGVPLNRLNQSSIQGLEMKNSAHLGIRARKSDGTVCLFMDGLLVKQWQDPYAGAGAGTCLRIVNQSIGALLANANGEGKPDQLKISNLVVSEWDGRLELPVSPVIAGTNDVIQMLNRDTLGGTIQEIREGQIRLAGVMGAMTVSWEQVSQLQFARMAGHPLPAWPHALHAYFNRRGRLILKPEGWEAGKMVASHPIFGRASLDLAAFRLLEWPE